MENWTPNNFDCLRGSKWKTNQRIYPSKKICDVGSYRYFHRRCLYDLFCDHQTLLMDILFTLVASVVLIIGFLVVCRVVDEEDDEEDSENGTDSS